MTAPNRDAATEDVQAASVSLSEAISACESLVDSLRSDDLRTQAQRALDLLRDAADSLEFVAVNVEEDE